MACLSRQPDGEYLLRPVHRVPEDLHARQHCPVSSGLRLPTCCGSDLRWLAAPRLDEAYKGLIMLACAVLYSAVLIGPWGALKDAARKCGDPPMARLRSSVSGFRFVDPARSLLAGRLVGNRLAGDAGAVDCNSRLSAGAPFRRVCDGARAVGACSLGRILPLFHPGQFLLCLVCAVRSDGLGLESVGNGRHGLVALLPGAGPVPSTTCDAGRVDAAVMVALRTAQRLGQSPRAALPVVGFCVVATLGLLALYLA